MKLITTNRGASGEVIFTMPAPYANAHYRFIGHAGQTITVKPDAVDTLVTFNDATADSIALSTTSEKIGGVIEVWCDGTSWFAWGTSLLHTFTIVT
jgi:hypothetical protein